MLLINDIGCRINNDTGVLLLYKINGMIRKMLTNIELEVKKNIYTEQKSLVAVKTMIELIDQIDHEVEEVPFKDKERLSRLLVSLKGAELNEDEGRLIERIVNI